VLERGEAFLAQMFPASLLPGDALQTAIARGSVR
jgi:hypothetical protein